MSSVKPKPKQGSDPTRPLPKSAWWHRRLEPEERKRVLSDLAVTRAKGRTFRFFVMLTLSVIVAVMGLLLNSAAVVIGAMLLAPLMQPVLATAATASMALFSKSLGSVTRVVIATTWCIAISYFLSKILPNPELTDEVMSRTRPDFRDLIVALAAGTAGAYATVREDASASLPGVAVAVALVPPLGSVGIALSLADYEKAWGAMLLYTTNLVAIVFAGIFVFVATGFVPPRRLASNVRRLGIAVVAMSGLVVLIGWPLIQASMASAQNSREESSASTVVTNWLALNPTDELDEPVEVNDELIRISLRGTGQPPNDLDLKRQLQASLGDREIRIEWVRIGILETEPDSLQAEETEAIRQKAETVITQWFEDREQDYQIDSITLEEQSLRIDASGTGDAPSIDDLGELLHDKVDSSLEPRLNWTERKIVRAGENTFTEIELSKQQMTTVLEKWSKENAVSLENLEFDGETGVITILGAEEPDITTIVDELQEITADEIEIEVYFTQQRLLTPTTTATSLQEQEEL